MVSENMIINSFILTASKDIELTKITLARNLHISLFIFQKCVRLSNSIFILTPTPAAVPKALLGKKFREMGTSNPGEASCNNAACFSLSRNTRRKNRNTTSALGMSQLFYKRTTFRKANGILEGAPLLRTRGRHGALGSHGGASSLERARFI